ncbi:hypothetical protein D9M72_597880 [compost metagenome]
MHVAHHVQLGQAAVADFLLHQRVGDDADGAAAVCHHGVGDDAHQAHLAAAVHQRQAAFGQGAAEQARAFGVFRTVAGAGPAIHADRFHFASFAASAAALAAA